jgi:hypothetical protein
MTTEIKSFEDLQNDIGNKKTLVFGGFSGLGYAEPTKLEEAVKERIQTEITKYGVENVAVVAGATSDGIGSIYKIAKDLGVTTYGIVSDAGKEYGSDASCDKTFFVPDPGNTWQVLSKSGESYMVDVAKNNGVLVYYGGGDVAVAEIKEAKEKGIKIETDVSYEPNPVQVEKKKAKNPNFDATPLKTFIQKSNAIEAIEKIRNNAENINRNTFKPN